MASVKACKKYNEPLEMLETWVIRLAVHGLRSYRSWRPEAGWLSAGYGEHDYVFPLCSRAFPESFLFSQTTLGK